MSRDPSITDADGRSCSGSTFDAPALPRPRSARGNDVTGAIVDNPNDGEAAPDTADDGDTDLFDQAWVKSIPLHLALDT